MDERDWLAQRFQEHRPRLRAVAYRMLGSTSEADDVGLALLVVLETLTPAERLAYVLHDMFSVPFEEIGAILERSPDAARQLASRGRRRIRAAETTPDADAVAQQEVVEAFLAAARDGDFDALFALLDPDVVLRADRAAVQGAASRQAQGVPALSTEVRGAAAVADIFSGQTRAARLALVDGAVGAVVAPGGRTRVVFGFTIMGGKVGEIDILADPARLARLDLTDIDSRL